MKTYNLIVMSFDGDVQVERIGFKTVEEAWQHASDMGSRWYFYPFCLVTTASSKTIVDAGDGLKDLNGKRLHIVRALFKELSEQPDMKDADVEDFLYEIQFRS